MSAENKIYDLLEDYSFKKYVLNGEYTSKWENWLKENPHHKKDFDIAVRIINDLSQENNIILNEIRQNETKRKIKGSLLQEINNNSAGNKNVFWKVAAAILVLITIGSVAVLIKTDTRNSGSKEIAAVQRITKHNPKGIKSIVTFSDGSKAYLNAESTLNYTPAFEADVREVALTGEAYFEITKDEKRPFVIYTDNINVNVLGTKFNVNAYPDNDNVKVALVDGKVSVHTKNGDNIVLNPSEMCDYSSGSKKYKVMKFNSEEEIGWKDNILFFKNESLRNIFYRLERWYGVDILYDENDSLFMNWEFTGKFENRSLEYILNTMNYENKFDFEIKDDKVIIK